MNLLDEVLNISDKQAHHLVFAITSYVEAAKQHDIKIDAGALLEFIKKNMELKR